MKKRARFTAAAFLILALCAAFGRILTIYCQPKQDQIYDLSLGWPTEAIPDGWVYNQKGWRVFTQEGNEITELTPDGFGGFSSIGFPGQTFYFSLDIQENLHPDMENPASAPEEKGRISSYNASTLRLDAANRTFAIFLDDALI